MTTDPLSQQRILAAFRRLRDQGLNLQAVLDVNSIPSPWLDPEPTEGHEHGRYQRIILLGNAGAQFWECLQQSETRQTRDPVDNFSAQLARRFADEALPGNTSRLLYPFGRNVLLQRLGELAGWHYPSPLGLGIHPHYGLWFAYRAVLITTAELAITDPVPGSSPCERCESRPCVTACPPRALDEPGAPDMATCLAHRFQAHSVCRGQCLARSACPVGTAWRYPREQTEYHYLHSLKTIPVPRRDD